MKALFLAASLAFAEREPPEWIHLVPFGEWAERGPGGGRLVIGQKEAAQLLANFRRRGQPLAIDWEHQSMEAANNGQPAPAAGWIHEVEVRTDGLWGRVTWTERAAAQLRAGEYRFFSPVIYFSTRDKKTKKPLGFAFGPGALTNQPFFLGELAPLTAFSAGGSSMSLLAFLCSTLGMPEDTPEETVREEISTRLGTSSDAAMSDLGKVAASELGWTELPADAGAQLKAKLKGKGVPHAEHLKVVGELATLRASAGRPDLVARGLDAGKLVPAMVGTFREMINAEGYDAAAAWLDNAPVILAKGTQGTPKNGRGPAATPPITAEERLAARQLGISEAELLAAKSS